MQLNFVKRNKKALIITSIVAFGLTLVIACCSVYVNDYYRADQKAIQAFGYTERIEEEIWKDGTHVYKPETGAAAGFIFYPGGKVEHTAYEPLMRAVAQRGIVCFLVEMPFRLAVLDVNAADGLQKKFPEIESWYIGGHSLGGSMAASYAKSHKNNFDGLILLASYSTENLTKTELSVLSVYGTNDKVMNRKKYQECKSNLPVGFTEYLLEGGNHAQFGMYGKQEGDGTATMSNVRQINLTATKIGDFIL